MLFASTAKSLSSPVLAAALAGPSRNVSSSKAPRYGFSILTKKELTPRRRRLPQTEAMQRPMRAMFPINRALAPSSTNSRAKNDCTFL